MNEFAKWLSEEVNPSELIPSPETIPSQHGTWILKEGKYNLIPSTEMEYDISAEVSVSFDLTTETVFADIATTLVVNEEEKEVCSKKVQKPRAMLKNKAKTETTKSFGKDIEEALDLAVEKRVIKEDEINESIIAGALVGLASALIMASPRLLKIAIEKGVVGKDKGRFRKYDEKDAIQKELSTLSAKDIQVLLKDRKAMDKFVDRTIEQVKKDMPLPMVHIPQVKAEIYERIEMALRRIAEFKSSKGSSETPVKDREFKTPISTGKHVGGVFLGAQK